LETNGSITTQNVPKYVVKIVDVKTPGSGFEDCFLRQNLKYIDRDNDEIKFVICDRKDYEWSKTFIRNNKLEEHKILFSAVTEKINPRQLTEWIIEDKLSVRMQLQLHKFIWDKDKRGV